MLGQVIVEEAYNEYRQNTHRLKALRQGIGQGKEDDLSERATASTLVLGWKPVQAGCANLCIVCREFFEIPCKIDRSAFFQGDLKPVGGRGLVAIRMDEWINDGIVAASEASDPAGKLATLDKRFLKAAVQ